MGVLNISIADRLGQDSRLEHHKFKKSLLIAMRIVFTLAESVFFFIINDIFLRNKCFGLLPKSVFADHDVVISSCCCLRNPRATFNKQNKLLNQTLNCSSQLFFYFFQRKNKSRLSLENILRLSAYLERNYISFFVLFIGFRFLSVQFSIYVGGIWKDEKEGWNFTINPLV